MFPFPFFGMMGGSSSESSDTGAVAGGTAVGAMNESVPSSFNGDDPQPQDSEFLPDEDSSGSFFDFLDDE